MLTLWSWLRNTFEVSRGNHGNIRSMEGMRGLAVTAIFLVHYSTLSMPYVEKTGVASTMTAIHLIGSAGVDLFFVLSGYLIYGAALKRPNYAQFMRRRIRRIYPAFLAVFSVYLMLSFAMPHESKIPHGAEAALVFIAENLFLLPGFFPIEPIVSVAWSLSYEMFYYAVIPLLVVGLGLHLWRPGQRVALFIALAAAGTLAASFLGGPIRAVMFFGGVLLYEAKDKRVSLPFVAPLALLGAFASMLITTGTHKLDDAAHVSVMFVTLPIFCFACFGTPASMLSRVLSARPIRWLGNMSYSYYLLHGLVLKIAFAILMHVIAPIGHQVAFTILMLLPLFLSTIAASTVLFVVIERPLSLREPKPSMAVAVG